MSLLIKLWNQEKFFGFNKIPMRPEIISWVDWMKHEIRKYILDFQNETWDQEMSSEFIEDPMRSGEIYWA